MWIAAGVLGALALGGAGYLIYMLMSKDKGKAAGDNRYKMSEDAMNKCADAVFPRLGGVVPKASMKVLAERLTKDMYGMKDFKAAEPAEDIKDAAGLKAYLKANGTVAYFMCEVNGLFATLDKDTPEVVADKKKGIKAAKAIPADGKLTAVELEDIVPGAHAAAVIKLVDVGAGDGKGGDGSLDFGEFVHLMSLGLFRSTRQMKSIVGGADGKLSAEEAVKVFTWFTKEEIAKRLHEDDIVLYTVMRYVDSLIESHKEVEAAFGVAAASIKTFDTTEIWDMMMAWSIMAKAEGESPDGKITLKEMNVLPAFKDMKPAKDHTDSEDLPYADFYKMYQEDMNKITRACLA